MCILGICMYMHMCYIINEPLPLQSKKSIFTVSEHFFGLKKAADLGKEKYGTNAAKFVRQKFYVDDGLTYQPTVTEAITLVNNRKSCALSIVLNCINLLSLYTNY